MQQTLFISDLHLDAERPAVTRLFRDFLAREAVEADALYILGDLFEAWIGDDDPDPHHADVKAALRGLVERGVPTYFMHGNRDFLIGDRFAADTGVQLLDDPTLVDLYGTPSLLMHGDSLCLDDVEYQQIRRQFRDPVWQQEFLDQPLEARKAFARQAREESRAAQAGKAMAIMDVNQAAVERTLDEYGVGRLIHGHTHRPAVHEFVLGDQSCERIVLGDWYTQGSVLRVTPDDFYLQVLPLEPSET